MSKDIKTAEIPELSPNASCKSCLKVNVCSIHRANVNLLSQFDPVPIDPAELAKICKEYFPPNPKLFLGDKIEQ